MKPRLVLATVGLVLTTAACGSMGSGRTSESKAGRFRLDEWSITADQPVLKPGRQTITAANVGHHTHELVIVRAVSAASLPTEADGSVDESRLEKVTVGEIADVPAGTSRHEMFDLEPGRYVAFCNIVEDMGMGMGNGRMGHRDHFSAGMHTEFTVSA